MKNKLFVIVILFSAFSLFAADYADIVNKGLLFLKQGMTEEAIKTFESARDAQPSSSIAYYYLGESYYVIGKRDEALENYKKAVELEDSNPDYHYALAQLYIATDKTEQAIEELTKTIEIAPSSIKGRQAVKLRDEIRASLGSKEMTEKWARLEEEERKKKEEGKAVEITVDEGAMPPGFEGMMPGMEKQAEVKIPVEQLIKRVKYGTLTMRQGASVKMLGYDQSDLLKVAPDITALAVNDKDATVRKNMMTALGKTALPEGINTLLGIIKDKKELYDMRITALDGISTAKTQEISSALKAVLDGMVEDRKAAREEAKKNIEEITAKVDNLEAQKIKLNMEISEQEQKKFELQGKLDFSEMPHGFDGMPPGMARPQGAPSQLNVQEIKKLREEMRKIDDTLKNKREEVSKMECRRAELNQQKGRYESLLAMQEKKRTDITMPGATEPAVQNPEFMVPPEFMGLPGYAGAPGGFGEFPGYEQVSYVETDEEKNEVIFALKLMRAIGEMRDKTGLPVVNKGWEEYGIENERLYYLLTLARLGDFNGMENLIDRLGHDYPQPVQSEEINLRKGIIGIAGEYLLQNPDNRLRELIEFLSEEDVYPEIREAALSALSIAKTPAK